MRFALFAAAALTAAATFVALAQPKISPQTPPPAPDTKLMPIDWGELRDELKNQRVQRVKPRHPLIAAGAPRPSLPMLLPFEPTLAAAATHVFPRPDSYSASMRIGDIAVEVHGERRAFVLGEKDPMARLMALKQRTGLLAGKEVPFSLEKTEGGFDLTFSRFGGAYLVSIECAKPEADERCVKEDFIRTLGQRMGLFGEENP